MTGIKIKVEQEFSLDAVGGLLCCAFEGGIGYWARVKAEGGTGTYLHEMALSEGGFVTLEDSTGEGWPPVMEDRLDLVSLTVGLQTMAVKYPKHFADFAKENYDATTGDVFVQCAVFGELIFG